MADISLLSSSHKQSRAAEQQAFHSGISMPFKAPSVLLSECLLERNLAINSSHFLRDIDSGGETLKTWIMETVNSETLLTKEELILYHSLQGSSEAKLLESPLDLGHVRAFDDKEVQKAIEQLENSTASIDKQNEILKVQQAVVSSLEVLGTQRRQRRSIANSVQHGLWRDSLDQANAAIGEIANDLSEYISGCQGQCTETDAALVSQSVNLLRSDDKILSSLQKLAEALQCGVSPENNTIGRIRKLCASLIKYTVEGVRLRLDRAYVGDLDVQHVDKNVMSQTEHEVIGLQAELDSLYSEILPVAQMSTEQRYLDCAVRAIATQDMQELERSEKILNYISDSTAFLTNRIKSFSKHMDAYQQHNARFGVVMKLLRSEIDSAEATLSGKHEALQSPVRLKNYKPVSPTRSRVTTHRRSSASSFDDSITPEQQILRLIGIPQTEEYWSLGPNLHETVTDKIQKLKAHEQSLQASSEFTIGEHLQDAFATVQLLGDLMLSETKYHKIQLLDGDVQEAIVGLEEELADLTEDIQRVDLEGIKEHNSKKKSIIERWAR